MVLKLSPAARRYALGGAGLAVVVGLAGWTSIEPRADRTWIPEQAVQAEATIEGNTVQIRNMRDFAYTARRTFTPRYAEGTFDLNKLDSAWYVLTPFSPGWRGPAHSFVTFGFADSQFVAISVEARREPGETYDAFTGLFKRFELTYVVGTERDLIGQRAALGTDRVYLYPVRAPTHRIRWMFTAMLERANRLRDRPEFYNTLTNNCTSNVIAHVNQIVPGAIPGGIKTVLPGYTDEVGVRLGLLAPGLDVESARARYLINDRARRAFGDPAFSLLIRHTPP